MPALAGRPRPAPGCCHDISGHPLTPALSPTLPAPHRGDSAAGTAARRVAGPPRPARAGRGLLRSPQPGRHRPPGRHRGPHRLRPRAVPALGRCGRRRVRHPPRGPRGRGRRPGDRRVRLLVERRSLVLLLRPRVVDRPRRPRHRPPRPAGRGLGLRGPLVDDVGAAVLRQRPRRRPLVGRGDGRRQPGQGRPGPHHLAADLRPLPLRPRVGGGEAALAVERRHGREADPARRGRGLQRRDGDRHPRPLTDLLLIFPHVPLTDPSSGPGRIVPPAPRGRDDDEGDARGDLEPGGCRGGAAGAAARPGRREPGARRPAGRARDARPAGRARRDRPDRPAVGAAVRPG
ncbi:hypothetical protein NOCARDAX2BIS_410010 [Nocardioides sp. AX2bis]|nr:hypothetical protein NOCARDAX2BIS_410010 [Nocardioides sp. AX2bis]